MGRPPIEASKKAVQINLSVTRETKEKLEQISRIDNVSLNKIVSKVLERYIEERNTDIQRYEEVAELLKNIRDERNLT